MRSEHGGPGVQFAISFDPSPKAIGMGFERWAKQLDDWRPVWTDVVELFRRHEVRQFDTEGVQTGPKWAKLSPAYAEWKQRHYPGRPILVLVGTLRQALTKKGPGWFEVKTARSLEVGLNPATAVGKIGGYLTTGTANMPARPPIRYDDKIHTVGLKEEAAKGGTVPFGTAIAQIMQVHIVNARKKGFSKAGVKPDPFGKGKPFNSRRKGVLALKTR